MGKSYLKYVLNNTPDKILQYKNEKITFKKVNYDLTSKAPTYNEIINNYTDYLENYLENKEVIHIDLTAGFDTRTVLALIYNRYKKKIIAYTLGKDGMDFQVASKIAKHFKLTHRNSSTTFSDSTEFIRHSKFLALCKNGDANSIRAIDKIDLNYQATIPKIIGVYGTIKFGKYTIGDIEFSQYQKLISKNKHKIEFFSDNLIDELKSRLFNYLIELKATYNDRNQEIYYIRERCGNWGNVVFNSTWNLRHICPFEDIIAMQNMLSLPKNIRRTTKIQHKILFQFSKFLYLYPINRNPFNNDYFSFIPEKSRLFIRKAWTYYEKKFERLFRKNIRDIAAQRLDKFHNYFSEYVKPMLKRQNSLNKYVLSNDNKEKLINNFEQNKVGVNHIAQLYTMELWKDLVDSMTSVKRVFK